MPSGLPVTGHAPPVSRLVGFSDSQIISCDNIGSVNRSEIIRGISYQTSLTQAEAEEALDAFVDLIRLCVVADEDVTIAGFGKFESRKQSARTMKNPKTGESVEVPEHRKVGFVPSRKFRNQIK